MKRAIINGRYPIEAFVDTGSSDCIMKASTAVQSCLRIEASEVSIWGFGINSKSKTIGKAKTDIEIDGVVVREVEVMIVPDACQPYELIIGRTWLESPGVTYRKGKGTIEFMHTNTLLFQDLDLEPRRSGIVLAAERAEIPPFTSMMLKAQLDGVTVDAPVTNQGGETELVEVGKVLARGVDLEKIKMEPEVMKVEEDNARTPLTS
ncbi:uncharacterized protein [Rhodnius prolixus]|uniref:uncharacterized protein n=1 Tax=Rhodnius prolixus TaxID=13249 RepID=UPI003D187AD8